MEKNYFLCLILMMMSLIGHCQYAILCPELAEIIRIENVDDIPTITDNGDNTITLTHPETYITDVFANHVLYDFFQTFPNTSETLEKYYTIVYSDKDLIVELNDTVPNEIFLTEHDYQYTPINAELASFIDGKIFRLTHYCSIADNFGEPCPEQEVPIDVNISVSFTYDASNDMILMESYGMTECGNTFSIALRGGNIPGKLQLWESIPGTIAETDFESDACHSIEEHLFSMLDISCNDVNVDDIIPTFDIQNNTLFLYRPNMIFGYHTATFVDANLSVEEHKLVETIPYQIDGNPFLQLSKADKNMFIEIYSISGNQILEKVPFENNSLLIDHYSNGIYFVKVSHVDGHSRTYKFVKR